MADKPDAPVWERGFLILILLTAVCWLVACGGAPSTKLPAIAAGTPTPAPDADKARLTEAARTAALAAAKATSIAARATLDAIPTPLPTATLTPSPLPTLTATPTSSPSPSATPTPTRPAVGGRIAFSSTRDGGSLFIMNADGSNVRRLAQGVREPRWSPDGRHIAVHCGESNPDVCVINADGSGLINVTSNPAYYYWYRWSPDSQRLVFLSNRDGQFDIYVVNANSTALTKLTDSPANDDWPSWSPDGQYVAFYSLRRGDRYQRIHVAHADGSGLADMADNPIGTEPAWAPDGQHIAFAGPFPSGNWDIYLMSPDGSGVVNLTHHPGFDAFPIWSPDSKHIAFQSQRNGDLGLFVMNADGSDVTFLNRIGGASLDAPTWSPDSRRIAFEVCSDESRPRWDCDIYVANADGSGLTNLTNHPANDFAPAWEPTP